MHTPEGRLGRPSPSGVTEQFRAGGRSAVQNVRDSRNYESTVHANSNFRAACEQQECGPIDDAKMHADCLATFD
jgi:hypothetical protein